MTDKKHHTVIAAELAKDLTIASSVKEPEAMAAAFKLFYATVLEAGRIDETDLPAEIERLAKEFREVPSMR